MYTIHDSNPKLADLDRLSKNTIKEILQALESLEKDKIIHSNCDLISECQQFGKIYHIVEGTLGYNSNRKNLFFVDEGDLVGLQQLSRDSLDSLSSDFAVKVDVYDKEIFFLSCQKDPELSRKLNLYFDLQREMLLLLLQRSSEVEVVLTPTFTQFKPSETIIVQGTNTHDVYTMVEGKAEAFVDSVKVGDINQGEIFGMLAAITGSARTAQVVASTNCLVAAVPKEQFVELIKQKPQAVLKTIEDMARLINDLNRQIV